MENFKFNTVEEALEDLRNGKSFSALTTLTERMKAI